MDSIAVRERGVGLRNRMVGIPNYKTHTSKTGGESAVASNAASARRNAGTRLLPDPDDGGL